MIQQEITKRILILDGAMGSVIQEYGLDEKDFRGDRFQDLLGLIKGNNDILNLTRPDVIGDIYERYLKAGADIISTNTFNAQRISQSDYGLCDFVREINETSARLAKKAAEKYSTPGKPRFVAGSVGPMNKTCSMSPDVSNPAYRELTYDQALEAYMEQIGGLVDGGADVILIETVFDTLNAKAAIDAAVRVIDGRDIPIMVSVTISDAAGRTLSGQTLDAFLASVSSYPIFSIGLNCSFGARQMKPYLKELSRRAPYYISCHPNAGLPNSLGLYDETPETMAPQIAEFIDEKLVNIVGGCCGTTPAFIEKYAPLVVGKEPHQPVEKPTSLWLSGLELLNTGEATFVNVGERCNVAGSRKFLRLIKEKSYEEALQIARKQVEDGAMVIDVNMDDGLLDAKAEMVHFLNLIASEPDIARVPVMIDSSKWDVIMAGLKCVQGKSIVNSISLKEGEEVFLSHARDVKSMGAAVVVMCFDEQGQATSYERRIEIAERAYRLLVDKVGFLPQDIIFDPNVLAIATGMEEHNAYALDFIRATEWIHQNLPGAHVSGGVSNLSFSFRGNNYLRESMHAVFLYHAIQVGMDFGIVNPSAKVTYDDIPQDHLTLIEDVVLNRHPESAEQLMELTGETGNTSETSQTSSTSASLNLEERLQEALIKGNGEHLDDDLKEALAKYPRAVDIIEGPLMAGMNEVGRRFGEGKMFLPQVVKTARTMKRAVEILQPFIDSGKTEGTGTTGNQRKVLLATVKGDVHDIGKNIVGVIMACNGYEVIDLGVMVPADQIVARAKEEHVDMIGLSGLITPSLEEMVNVASELKKAGLDIPIMIGGATTSELHVALKIAPVYGGPVVWLKDASQNPLVAQRLMADAEGYNEELNRTYAHLREQYIQEQQQLLSLDEARRRKTKLFE
ncbi:methionine synthase [Prevotella communis]|uniref:methionine synthase n=1 Tax=Prevotella communis TaxID=2913614 RepID=UPI001EDC217D|nr:methionine synthase [Prevotella communis]UKK60949.1 methionine synthase [Prevotella communis]UKK63776.1 methionine synthase [Prevotella communis]UKK68869.1 methionine synthase [Prevotella communis]UKK71656.1 methionine synthase [Prevotella communis]